MIDWLVSLPNGLWALIMVIYSFYLGYQINNTPYRENNWKQGFQILGFLLILVLYFASGSKYQIVEEERKTINGFTGLDHCYQTKYPNCTIHDIPSEEFSSCRDDIENYCVSLFPEVD